MKPQTIFVYKKVSDKIAYANWADPDQIAPQSKILAKKME